jgi:hypothetical protein
MNTQNDNIYTAIDANLNRAVEGIRVCEDVLRFITHDERSINFKELRHKLIDVLKELDTTTLLNARNVTEDKQKFVDLSSEKTRDSIESVFKSNISRAQESMRCLEEFSKLICPENSNMSAELQKIRFELYSLEKDIFPIIRDYKYRE